MARLKQLIAASSALLMCATANAQTKEEVIEPNEKQMAMLQALTPQGVADLAVVEGDELEPSVTITTEKAYKSRGAFTDRVRSDNFLRAFITKRTGAARYQLYQTVTYGTEWRNFNAAVFSVDGEAKAAEVVPIAREILTCAMSACVYIETVAFNLDERTLEKIASLYVAGRSPLWRFRFKAKNGVNWEDRIAPAEAAGMLEAVRRYRANHTPVTK